MMTILTGGEGNGNPLQYSCLENPMDRGAWWATVHGVVKSQTRLKQLSTAQHILTGVSWQLIIVLICISTYFHMPTSCLYVFFGEMSYLHLLLIFWLLSSDTELYELPVYLGNQSLASLHHLQFFLPACRLSFCLIYDFLHLAKAYKFG